MRKRILSIMLSSILVFMLILPTTEAKASAIAVDAATYSSELFLYNLMLSIGVTYIAADHQELFAADSTFMDDYRNVKAYVNSSGYAADWDAAVDLFSRSGMIFTNKCKNVVTSVRDWAWSNIISNGAYIPQVSTGDTATVAGFNFAYAEGFKLMDSYTIHVLDFTAPVYIYLYPMGDTQYGCKLISSSYFEAGIYIGTNRVITSFGTLDSNGFYLGSGLGYMKLPVNTNPSLSLSINESAIAIPLPDDFGGTCSDYVLSPGWTDPAGDIPDLEDDKPEKVFPWGNNGIWVDPNTGDIINGNILDGVSDIPTLDELLGNISDWVSDVGDEFTGTMDKYWELLQELLGNLEGTQSPAIPGVIGLTDNAPTVAEQEKAEANDPTVSQEGTASPENNQYMFDLSSLFPFCIPFDLINLFRVLKAEPEAPHITYNITAQLSAICPWADVSDQEMTLDIDFSQWEMAAAVFRTLETIGFIFGLIIVTRNHMIRG